jgi:hypothetical protein
MIHHVLDIMHCEKNLTENIIMTLLGDKDTLAIRKDLRTRGIRQHL